MCQIEMFEKIITVKIISFQGHQNFYLDLCEVREFILNQSKNLKLWLYVDGINMNPSNIASEILSSARDIILTSALVGG
jgi:hypothetical protein